MLIYVLMSSKLCDNQMLQFDMAENLKCPATFKLNFKDVL
jgi:hypothetical protein